MTTPQHTLIVRMHPVIYTCIYVYTPGLFAVVLSLFMASVCIDIYRKLVRGGSFFRRCANKVAPDTDERQLLSEKLKTIKKRPLNQQWLAPVNPFGTLQSQNEKLIRAEEERIARLMQRKMKHLQELQERDRKREEEKERYVFNVHTYTLSHILFTF